MKGNGRRNLEVGESVVLAEDGRRGTVYDIDESNRPPRYLLRLEDDERRWVEMDEIEEPA